MQHVPLRALFTAVIGLGLVPAANAFQTLYATSGPVNPSLLEIDTSNGAIMSTTPITGEEALFGGLTFSSDGASLFSIDGYNDANSDRTFRIDAGTGAGVVVGDTGFNWNFRSVEVHPGSGTLYAVRDSELFTIDPVSGAATSVAALSTPGLGQVTAMAIAPNGTAYVTDTGTVGLYTVDLGTGAVTDLGALTPSQRFQDLAVAADGTLWGVGFPTGDVYTIDPVALTATLEFSSQGFAGIAFLPSGEVGTSFCFGDGTGGACPCGNTGGAGEGCANGTGSGAVLGATGFASVANDSIVLHVSGSVPNQPGLLFQGDNSLNGGLGFTFGDGLRCAGGNVVRLQTISADASGEVDSTVGIAAATGVAAGETKAYQWWYRDPVSSSCGAQFNLSSGLELTWSN